MRKITENSKENVYQPSGFSIWENKTVKLSEVRSKQNNPMFALISNTFGVTYSRYRLWGKIVNDLDYPVLICTPEKMVCVHNNIDGDVHLTSYGSTNNFKVLSPGEELNYNNENKLVLGGSINQDNYMIFFIVFF